MRASLLALLAPVLGHAASLEERIGTVVEGKPTRAEEGSFRRCPVSDGDATACNLPPPNTR